MKKLVLFFLLIVTFYASAQQGADKYRMGTSLYQQKKYKEAVKVFESLLTEGVTGSNVYYNLGNSYFRSGHPGLAILNYERALKQSPKDEDIQHNIRYVNSTLQDKLEEVPTLFIYKWWNGISGFFTINGWSIVILILLILIVVSIGLFFMVTELRIKQLSFYLGLLLLFLILLSTVIVVVRVNVTESTQYAIVLEPSVQCKTSPDEGSKDAFAVHEGLKLKVEDEVDNWLKVKTKNGKICWILKSTVAII